ncbi:hypothetical protein [Tsukamurella tyrosinosolvens]|uniref:hypothetical protein n=1 Tax=Tsukamurella tyrosinosolvens TaxID=57704 RepID=UPI0034629A52
MNRAEVEEALDLAFEFRDWDEVARLQDMLVELVLDETRAHVAELDRISSQNIAKGGSR